MCVICKYGRVLLYHLVSPMEGSTITCSTLKMYAFLSITSSLFDLQETREIYMYHAYITVLFLWAWLTWLHAFPE